MSESARSAQATSAPALPEDPFPGIGPYGYRDRNVFFGREKEARDLIRLVVMYRGVLLFSESGSGKSSLINAGLIPLALEEGYQPEKIRVQPTKGKEIVIEKITEDTPGASRRLPTVFPSEENAERTILPVEGFLRCLREKTAGCHPLLIFDQFEEWATLFEESATGETASDIHQCQERILNAIVDLLRDTSLGVKLLISLREDYLAKLTPLFKQYPALTDQYLRLTSPMATEIADLIHNPFKTYPGQYPREINASLAQEIQKDFEKKSSTGRVRLTEVQIVCQTLFESGQTTQELQNFFVKQGRAEGLLIQYVEHALQSLREELREPAVCLLGRMITTAGTRNVIQEDDLLSRVASEQSLPTDLLRKALRSLEENTKLIRREPRQNVYYYEIASEFLIGWIQTKFQEHEQHVQQERRWQAARAAQKAKRRRLVIPSMAAAIVVLVVFAIVSWRLARSWSQQAREADSRRLALYAHDLVDVDPDLSILLALQATRKTYDTDQVVTAEAERALREVSEKVRRQSVLMGHIGSIKDLVFSEDGKRLASASDDGTAKIWDVSQGKLLVTLSGHEDAVFDLAFDRAGKLLATASRDHTIRIWDSSSGKSLFVIHVDGGISDIAFNGDGTQLAAELKDGSIKAWGLAPGKISPLRPKERDRIFSSSFSRDLIAVENARIEERLILRDAVSGRVAHTLYGATPAVDTVLESPNRKQIATASADGTVKLWDAQSGRQLFTLSGQQGGVTKLVFAPGGAALATAGKDGAVNVWDLSSHHRLYSLRGRGAALTAIAFSPDGTRLATAADNDSRAELWDTSSNGYSYVLSSLFVIAGLTISPDGKQMAGLSANRSVTLWDISSGKVLRMLEGSPLLALTVAFSRDGGRLAAAGRDGMLAVWDSESGTVLFHIRAHEGLVNAMVFSGDGSRITTAGLDGAVKTWDASSGQQLHSYAIGVRNIFRTVLSPDGHHLATFDQNGTLKIVDAGSGKQPVSLPHIDLAALCFDASGGQLATWDAEGGARLWDASTGRLLRTFAGATGPFNRIAFSNDGRQLIAFNSRALSTSGGIRMWDTDSGLSHTIPQATDSSVVGVNSNPKRLVVLTSPSEGTRSRFRSEMRVNVNSYPLAIKELIDAAQSRASHSISTQECRDYYLSGPPCKAAGFVEEGTKVAQAGNLDAATAKFKHAKELDPTIPLDPETEAGRLAAQSSLVDAQALARGGDVDGAAKKYEEAKHFDASMKFDSQTEARRVAARASVERGDLVAQFAPLDAMNAYLKALELNPNSSIAPEKLNTVCWEGSLDGHAREVMPSCELAVSLAPSDTNFRDSRGLARALAGDTPGAIQDFEAFIRNPSQDKSMVVQRQEWVNALKAGQKPFTAEVLKALQSR